MWALVVSKEARHYTKQENANACWQKKRGMNWSGDQDVGLMGKGNLERSKDTRGKGAVERKS